MTSCHWQPNMLSIIFSCHEKWGEIIDKDYKVKNFLNHLPFLLVLDLKSHSLFIACDTNLVRNGDYMH